VLAAQERRRYRLQGAAYIIAAALRRSRKPVSLRTIYSSEPAVGWLPWGVSAPLLGMLFVIGPFLSVSVLLERAGLLDGKGDPIGLAGLYALLLVPFGLIGVVVLAWVRWIERRPLATIGLATTGAAARFGRGHLLGAATISLVVAAIWLAGGYQAGAWAKALASPVALAGIAWLLVCFAVQSSAEEILFRGWLLSLLTRKFNIVAAVTVSSLVFCALHWGPGQHWLATVNVFLFGVFACSLVLHTGHLWSAMGWHAGWNWLLAVGFELPVTGIDVGLAALLVELSPAGPGLLTGAAQGPEGSIVCTLFFVAGSGALLLRAAGRRTVGR
jgi:uncharacterized protein